MSRNPLATIFIAMAVLTGSGCGSGSISTEEGQQETNEQPQDTGAEPEPVEPPAQETAEPEPEPTAEVEPTAEPEPEAGPTQTQEQEEQTEEGECDPVNGLPCEQMADVDAAPPGAAPPESNVGDPSTYNYTVQQYINYIVTDLDQSWSPWFIQSGYSEPLVWVEMIEPGEPPYTMPCGNISVTHDYQNAYYCEATRGVDATGNEYVGGLVLPVTTFQKMWNGEMFEPSRQSKRVGDFAAAIILAHEFGHQVENELYQQSVAAGQQVLELKQGNKNRELIADCFAGVWAGTKYYDGLMEPGDFDEAVAAIETIGDVAGAPESHGTSEERKAALIYGYQGDAAGDNIVGTPQQCIAQYWW
jgi:hypothetical protein